MLRPAARLIAPPEPLVPLPTLTRTAPPRPAVLAPLPMLTAPELPPLADPELNTSRPLLPAAPPFADVTLIDPLLVCVPSPLPIATDPPLDAVERPQGEARFLLVGERGAAVSKRG